MINRLVFKKTTLLFFILGICFACKKDEILNTDPKCIKERVEEFSISANCSNASVDAYEFQGNIVYVFEPGTCGADMTTEVVDNNCITIGYLGGIAGNTKINGDEFTTAVFVKNIWKK